MHKIFLAIIFAFGAVSIHAQDKRFEYTDSALLKDETVESIAEEERDILSDTSIYINRIVIPADTITTWKSDKRFAYIKNLDSLLKRKQQEDLDAYNKASREKPNRFLEKLFASGILQLLFWAVAIGFAGFILYKLFLSNGIFQKRSKANAANKIEEEVETIATVADYDKLIHQSIKLAEYRLAVRYLFLKTLSHLKDKEYIFYSADKTNYQYVNEVRADRRNEFASLVLNYEYIWYGNFPLSADVYTGIEKKFTSFNTKIQ